jgi:hypothetical protein
MIDGEDLIQLLTAYIQKYKTIYVGCRACLDEPAEIAFYADIKKSDEKLKAEINQAVASEKQKTEKTQLEIEKAKTLLKQHGII